MNLFSLSDLISAPFWLLTTALLALATWRASAWTLPNDDTLSRLLHTVVLSWAAVVAAVFVLSALGSLYASLLLTVVGVGAVAVLLFDKARKTSHPSNSQRFRRRSATEGRRNDFWYPIWLLYASLAAAAVVRCGLLEFPRDWDSLAYHIPHIDQWLRAKTLTNINSSSWFHPGNNELIGLWCVGPFSGDFLIALNNIPAVFVMGLGARELAMRLGARRSTAHLTGLASLTPYVVRAQLLNSENDVAAAGLFVATMAYGIRLQFVARAGSLFLWATCIGLLPGVKYYALGYAALAGLSVTLLTLRTRGIRAAMRVAVTGLTGILLLSGYWYVRNAILTGTPLYPKGFFGMPNLMAETFPHLRATTLAGHADVTDIPLLLHSIWRLLGPADWAACILLPITVGMMIGRCFGRTHSRRRAASAAVGLVVLFSVAIFATTPFVVETQPGTRDMLLEGYLPGRFLLPTATLALIALTQLADATSEGMRGRSRVPRGEGRGPFRDGVRAMCATGPQCLFAALALGQMRSGRPWPSPGDPLTVMLAGLDLFFAIAIARKTFDYWFSPIHKRILLGTCLIAASAAVSVLGARWQNSFAAFYDRHYQTKIFTTLERDIPHDAPICSLLYCSYPFLGAGRQFDVSGPVWAPTYAALHAYLLQRQAQFVVASTNEPRGNRHYEEMPNWLSQHGELYKQIYSDKRFCLYRMIGVAGPGATTAAARRESQRR
jgi:hypothetical protein